MAQTYDEKTISMRRLRYLIVTLLLFLAGQCALFYNTEILLDKVLCLLAIDLFFLLLFCVVLLHKRVTRALPTHSSTSYQKIFLTCLLSWCVLFASMFLPDYFAPYLLIGVILATSLDASLAMALSVYFVTIFALTQDRSMYLLCMALLLVISGVLLCAYLGDHIQADLFGIYLLLFLLQFMLPVLFYYLAHYEISLTEVLYGIATGVGSLLLVMLLSPRLIRMNQSNAGEDYRRFLADDYPLVGDIRRFSMAEYHHGKRVSRLAALCAAEIGADMDCARMAGFYYRLGKMEGEPEIDNALRLANDHCFPADVMQVMEEYGGVVRLPQTQESAIVHMVDALVTKIELLDADTMSSTWNQDMVIYQTLNELSGKGIYDESGISINQFLKIREKLVREDSLL